MRPLVLALMVCAACASVSAAGIDASTRDASCPSVLVLSSRGSGDIGSTTASLGAPGKAMYDRLRRLIPDAEAWGNPYNAVGVFSLDLRQVVNGAGALSQTSGLGVGAYHDSVNDGKKLLTDKIHQTISACGTKTTLVLTGYSQGAQVTGDVYQRNLSAADRSHVAGVVLFGDPYFFGGDRAADIGSFFGRRDGILGKRPRLEQVASREVISVCHSHDPICQGVFFRVAITRTLDPGALTFRQHKNYTSFGEPTLAANRIAALIAWYELPFPNFDGAQACGSGTKIADRVHRDRNNAIDNGGADDFFWAIGQGSQDSPVYQTGPSSYCSVYLYTGTFMSVAGSSPDRSGQIRAGVHGSFKLAWLQATEGDLTPDAQLFGTLPDTVDWQCTITNGDHNCPGRNPAPLFDSSATYKSLPQFDYRYRSNSGQIFWSSNRGKAGDILG